MRLKQEKAPCKGCPDMYVGCHGKCDKYKEYRKRLDEAAAKRREQYKTECLYHQYIKERKERMK